MDVSSKDNVPSGQELVETVIQMTELPVLMIQRELEHILDIPGKNVEEVTLDQLRESMLAYLDFVDAEVKARLAEDEELESSISL